MTNGVFLIAEDGTLIEMAPAPPESEDRLQALIADYPDLLAGDQIDHGSPRRWLLVSREMAVPDSRAATRWAVDHLFLDQDGVPTLVEVKRHGDTRARRAVVGQMLDYAANAVVHWPVDVIKDRYAAHCAAGAVTPTRRCAPFSRASGKSTSSGTRPTPTSRNGTCG